jgi:hypothetical protein
VTLEEDDYFGMAVIEAARLCAAAGAGQILVSDLVHRIAGDRDRSRPVGELELKGLPEPVSAFEVAWEPQALEGAPLPGALARVAAGGTFAGRREELALLDREWARAVDGERRVVLVSGEPGVGKTRLAAELAQRLHDEGAVVLYGRCEAELTGPFWPIAEALHQLVELLDVAVLREHVRVYGGELCRLVPELSRRLPGVPPPRAADPDSERLRLFDAVLGLLDAAARPAPLLLVLDDLQWADRPSLQLLLHTARGSGARLLVVAAHRAAAFDWTEAFRAVLGDLLCEPAATPVALSGLGDADTVTLLEDAVGHAVGAPGAALARRLRRETEGNPFYVKELLRDLEDSGGLLDERGLRRLASDLEELEVPLTVQRVVSQRVVRLGPDVSRVLGMAAVLGRTFDFEVLARVAEAPETALLGALDAACEAGIAVAVRDRPGRFSFSHALVAHALTEGIGPLHRRRIHHRVGEVLEAVAGEDPDRAAELAHHWIAAGDHAKGVAAAMRAGDRALEQLAPYEAALWYERALDVERRGAADPGLQAELLLRLGGAEARAGVGGSHEHLLAAARLAEQHDDPRRYVRAALADNRGMVSRLGTVDDGRVAMLESALEAAGPSDSGPRALLLATLSSELLWTTDPARRLDLSDRALAIARRLGDDRVLAEVIYRRCLTIAQPATVDERLALTAELLAITGRLGDARLRCLASAERGRVAMERADLPEALRHVELQQRFARESGNAYARHVAAWAQPWPLILAGRYEEGERAAEAALAESMSSQQPDAIAHYGSELALIRWDQGRLGELADASAAAAAAEESLPAHRALAAVVLLEAGRAGEAAALVTAALRGGFADPVDTTWLTGMTLWGEAAARLGDQAASEILLERLAPWRRQLAFPGSQCFGAVARVAGLLAATLGRWDAADGFFATAARIHADLAAPALLARTQLNWAAAMLARDPAGAGATRAAQLLMQARDGAAAAGCEGIARDAGAALRGLGSSAGSVAARPRSR